MKIWTIALLCKLVLAAWIPLSGDESYYWFWSQNLQLSYYDHPPFVAWLFWLSDLLPSKFMVRWPGVFLGHAALLIWLWALKPEFPRLKKSLWWPLVLFNPLIGPGSLFITPDIPLLFFWGLAFGAWVRLKQEPQSFTWPILFGLSMGLGFSSKYSIALLAILVLVDFLTSANLKTKSFLKALALSIPIGIFFSLPVWIWNYKNHWISFLFQLNHGLGGDAWKLSWTSGYIFSQLALVFPPILYLALRSSTSRTLNLFAWGPILFFLFTSLKGRVEANWAAPSYPIIFALAAQSSDEKWKQRLVSLTSTVWIILFASVLSLLAWPWSNEIIRRTKLNEMILPSTTIAQVEAAHPLYARSYQLASKLSFELGRPVYKLRGMSRRDFFDELEGSLPPSDGAFYLVADTNDQLPAPYSHFRILHKIPLPQGLELWEVSP